MLWFIENYNTHIGILLSLPMLLDVDHVVFYIFVIVTLVLVFYYVYFFAKLAFYTPKAKKVFQQHPVSIIVCAKNEDENLARNIPGLVFQKYSSTYQVIVVNDHSTDDSKYILQQLSKKFKVLEVIELENQPKMIPGKKFPLSVGIREADHELLLLTDADCVPASEFWLQKMQDAYEEGIDIVLGYSPYHKLRGLLNKVIRFETFHTALQYLSYALAGKPYMGVGRNISYKKSLFLANKGFASINHIPGGDDDLFINKVATSTNTAIMIDAEAHTMSTPKRSWREWIRQKTRHYSTSKYYKPIHRLLLSTYSMAHFLFYPLLIAIAMLFHWPWALGIFIVKTAMQIFIYARCMKKLNEADLIPWILFMDIGMFFYYLFFSFTLFKKEKKEW